MTEPAEKTESLRDYAEMLGSPDPTTTARMRTRLDDYMQRRRSMLRRWLLGVVAVGVIAGATALVLGPGRQASAVLTAEREHAVEIGATHLVLRVGASVQTEADDDARIELLAGEIDVTVASGHPFVVGSGGFEVRADGGRFAVRHTEGLPVVTVAREQAVILGPGLPPDGIRVLASPIR